jgi:hypothetical protein
MRSIPRCRFNLARLTRQVSGRSAGGKSIRVRLSEIFSGATGTSTVASQKFRLKSPMAPLPGRRAGAGIIMALGAGSRGYTKAIVAAQMLAQIGAFARRRCFPITSPAETCRKPTRGSLLPDVAGQENGGGGTGQAGEPAGAEAQHPCGELQRPAELIERDAEEKRSEKPAPKPMQE